MFCISFINIIIMAKDMWLLTCNMMGGYSPTEKSTQPIYKTEEEIIDARIHLRNHIFASQVTSLLCFTLWCIGRLLF